MWLELVAEYGEAETREPASHEMIDQISRDLNQVLPDSLRSLLLETDGIQDSLGTDVVWTAVDILENNKRLRNGEEYRDVYMPFDSLLFFGDNGGGDQFAFVRSPERDEVFVWDHETDSRQWVSADLESFLRRSLESEGDDWYRG